MSVIKVNQDNFEKEVLQSDRRVLLDFYADWCGPCRILSPIVEEIAEENEHIAVGKINVDDEVELAIQFGVSSIPTLVVMEKGEKVGQMIGYRPKEEILKLL